MAERARFKVWATAAMLVGLAAALAVGCSAGNQPPGEAVGDGSGGTAARAARAEARERSEEPRESSGGTAGTIVVPDGGPTDGGGGGPCVPATCMPVGGTYCGQIGDDCGGSIDCGVCTGDWTCEQHVCVGGPSCTPNTACTVGSAQFCGTIGDGCGRGVDCGTCPAGLECRNRLCVAPGCVPAVLVRSGRWHHRVLRGNRRRLRRHAHVQHVPRGLHLRRWRASQAFAARRTARRP